MLHWLNVELWSPMWPNMFAPSLITLPVVIGSHIRASRQRRANHEDMKQHVTESNRKEGP
jgi:hypothetical protein